MVGAILPSRGRDHFHTSTLRIRIIWVSGIDKTGTAGSKQSFDLLDRFIDHAGWLARVKLALQVNECLIGAVETPCQHPRNVEEHDRVEQGGLVSDVKVRAFRGTHVRSVRLIQQRSNPGNSLRFKSPAARRTGSR